MIEVLSPSQEQRAKSAEASGRILEAALDSLLDHPLPPLAGLQASLFGSHVFEFGSTTEQVLQDYDRVHSSGCRWPDRACGSLCLSKRVRARSELEILRHDSQLLVEHQQPVLLDQPSSAGSVQRLLSGDSHPTRFSTSR